MFNRLFARHQQRMFRNGCSQPSKLLCKQLFKISAVATLTAGFMIENSKVSLCEAMLQEGKQPMLIEEDYKYLKQLRPAGDSHQRLDELHLSKKENQEWLRDHVIHGHLNKETGIEVYEIYKTNEGDELISIIKFGSALNGYPGIVHGGITALMFDNSFGWLLLFSKSPEPAVTANLNVNYR